jgi:hypothetical protein
VYIGNKDGKHSLVLRPFLRYNCLSKGNTMAYIKAILIYIGATMALAAASAAVGFTLGLMYGATKYAVKFAAGLI